MTKQAREGLICPVCGEALTKVETRQFICPNRHAFDIARQGFVNLILPKQQDTTVTGDARDMIAARTRFLESGAYQPLADKLSALLCADAAKKAKDGYSFCDAGCGEGYYTNRLAQALQNNGGSVFGFGFDLARDGVRHAASAAKMASLPMQYCVASLFRMPLTDASMDAVLNCFAPCAAEEFYRILKPNGLLLMTVPGKRHLYGLKQCLYDTPYENEERRDVLDGFTDPEVVSVRYEADVFEHREALFRMTPYYWKTSRTDQEKLAHAKQLTTEIAFDILCYRKK